MSYLAPWIYTPFAQSLGWTLVHFLWEGSGLAVMLLAVMRIYRTAPSRRRYALACTILAAMPLVFAVTLAIIWARQPAAPVLPPVLLSPAFTAAVTDAPLPPAPARFTLAGILYRLAWLVPLWFAGVVFFYMRGIAGWVGVQRLRRRGVCAVSPEWQARLDELAARMRLTRPIALLESCLTDTPVLIGYLRPVVLLPLGCLTGLSAGQLECILLHELAHVGRHDYIVNLLQGVVEGLLFYHPAVWWASSVVRAERENCCDDRVVELMGDARSYAATLAALENRRAPAPHPALAATGGPLMKRIRRLTMESGGAQTSASQAASAALLLVIFAAGLAAVPGKLPKTRRPRTTTYATNLALAAAMHEAANPQDVPPMATPYQKWLTEDVVYIITDAERAQYQSLTSDTEREAFIEQFWQRRDPSPGTPENEFRDEHYRRIAYANDHFRAIAPGWKMDRGRVYITYGPPDEIDDHSAGGSYQRPPEEGGGITSTVPFQQWRYRFIEGIGTNVIVEFVDPTLSGEFHMTMDPHEKERAPGQQPAGGLAMLPAKPVSSASVQDSQPVETSYKKWLNQDVTYIITDEERAAFLRLQTEPEREHAITEFWKRRDPSPDTPVNEYKDEHYRRVAYANEHFTTGIPGWKTDRGRIYITYGAPDSVTKSGPRTQIWNYRLLEGLGANVTVEFYDQSGAGDFHMTKDPAGKGMAAAPQADPAAKVFVAHQNLAVSVIVPKRGQANAQSGVIGVGDVLDVTYSGARAGNQAVRNQSLINYESAIATKNSECVALRRTYQPDFPDVIRCEDQKRALIEQRDNIEAGHDQLSILKTRETSLLAEIRSTILGIENKQRQVAQISTEVRDDRVKLAAMNPVTQGAGPTDEAKRLEQESQNKNSQINLLNLQIATEKQYRLLLESDLANNRAAQSQVQATAAPVRAQISVRPDGKIAVNFSGDVVAAGLTPSELAAKLGPNYTVRVVQSADQMVTVLAPLESTTGKFHVFAEVTTQNRVVTSFDENVSGQAAAAKSFPLRAGAYHLEVTVRDLSDGRERKSTLDFTVD